MGCSFSRDQATPEVEGNSDMKTHDQQVSDKSKDSPSSPLTSAPGSSSQIQDTPLRPIPETLFGTLLDAKRLTPMALRRLVSSKKMDAPLPVCPTLEELPEFTELENPDAERMSYLPLPLPPFFTPALLESLTFSKPACLSKPLLPMIVPNYEEIPDLSGSESPDSESSSPLPPPLMFSSTLKNVSKLPKPKSVRLPMQPPPMLTHSSTTKTEKEEKDNPEYYSSYYEDLLDLSGSESPELDFPDSVDLPPLPSPPMFTPTLETVPELPEVESVSLPPPRPSLFTRLPMTKAQEARYRAANTKWLPLQPRVKKTPKPMKGKPSKGTEPKPSTSKQ